MADTALAPARVANRVADSALDTAGRLATGTARSAVNTVNRVGRGAARVGRAINPFD
jgi:hypothetical protein